MRCLGARPAAAMARSEEGTDLLGRGLLLEDGDAHDAAREVIDDDGDEPAEGPDRWERARKPRDPEAERGRNRGEVRVPDFIGSARRHDSTRSPSNARASGASVCLSP